MAEDGVGAQLVEWGKVALLETRGRVSGRMVTSPVGFVEEADGSLLIAAGADDADWALNLRHTPIASATVGDATATYEAAELADDDRNSAVTQLILKYGTPAERLGRGPAFRLRRRV